MSDDTAMDLSGVPEDIAAEAEAGLGETPVVDDSESTDTSDSSAPVDPAAGSVVGPDGMAGVDPDATVSTDAE